MKYKVWSEHPSRSLWQHEIWQRFQEALGRKTWHLETPFESALIIRHSLPRGLCWLEIPRGPLFSELKHFQKFMHEIEKLGKQEKAVFIRFSSYDELSKAYRLKPTRYDRQPQTSLILDLSLSESDLLKQMKPKGRYNIKLADKHGVIIKTGDDVTDFYNILRRTGRRDGFGIHPKAYYQTMLDALGPHAQLLLAEYQGQVIAGGIFVFLDQWGIYYYGASDDAFRSVMAPYLIQWEAIKEAKRRGCSYYDFLGIAPEGAKNHPWAGVTEFKLKFGGKIEHYPQAKDRVLRPFWYTLYKFMKYVRRSA